MKINNRKICSTLILLQYILLLLTCKNTTEPEKEIKLKLEKGYYQKVSESSNEIKYSIEFNYLVKGVECKVGGYGIKWDENHSGQVDWYMMQTISPQNTYSISDTFKLSYDLTSDPVVTMQGYLENSSESDPRLRDQCTLKRK